MPCNAECIIEGRRIIEMGTFSKEMMCKHCNLPLTFNIKKEISIGILSVFHIICNNCQTLNRVKSGKMKSNGRIGHINLKLALGKNPNL